MTTLGVEHDFDEAAAFATTFVRQLYGEQDQPILPDLPRAADVREGADNTLLFITREQVIQSLAVAAFKVPLLRGVDSSDVERLEAIDELADQLTHTTEVYSLFDTVLEQPEKDEPIRGDYMLDRQSMEGFAALFYRHGVYASRNTDNLNGGTHD